MAAPAPVLKPCIAIENGKKKLTRNQQCVCPSGWHLSDKCFTPITDKTAPCSFVDNFESQGVATLNCANVKQQGYHNTEEFVVPGITTDLDFSNSRIFNFQVAKIDGAYRLQVLKGRLFKGVYMYLLAFLQAAFYACYGSVSMPIVRGNVRLGVKRP